MGLKKNILFNSTLTVSNYIFPLITFPYISRVLGVTNVGVCNFVDGIINYFVLFSMMGINFIGIREISKNKNDKRLLEKSFANLFFLNTIFTLIMLIGLLFAVSMVAKLQEYKNLMYIGAVKLLFNLFLVEWFYKGIEEFKYITVRSIVVRVFYVASVFFFVHKKDDYMTYYILTTCVIMFNAFFNWSYLRQHIGFRFKDISLNLYWKSFLVLGVYAILTSVYTSFNVVFLGFATNDTEVGFYTTATKIYSILFSLFTAFSGVLFPHMSALVAKGDFAEVKRIVSVSYSVLFLTTIPIIIYSVIFAPAIILIIAGNGYEGAVVPMRIIMPLMLVIGIEQILIMQLLMPLGKDKPVFINSMIGFIVGITLNIVLVPVYKSVGSSLVWLFSECIVLFSANFFVQKYLRLSFPMKEFFSILIYFLPLVIICLVTPLFCSTIVSLIVAVLVGLVYVFVTQVYGPKNEYAQYVIEQTKLLKGRFL
jgi:Membrane protein involved in the export of O-antigen and teichoic acid